MLPKRERLPESEYNFDGVEEADLEVCVNYELARESKRVSEAPAPSQHSFRHFLSALKKLQGFPAKAWTLLEPKEQDELRSVALMQPQRYLTSIASWPVDCFFEEYFRRLRFNEDFCLGSGFQFDPNVTFVLEVDFRESDAFLVKQFKRWLRIQRQILREGFNGDEHPYQEGSIERIGKSLNRSVVTNYLDWVGTARHKRHAASGCSASKMIVRRSDRSNLSKRMKALDTIIERFEDAVFNPRGYGLPLQFFRKEWPNAPYSGDLSVVRRRKERWLDSQLWSNKAPD